MEDLSSKSEETNKLVDEVKNENQSLKVHVKCLKEKLSESNDKLKKISCTKHDV